MNRFPRFLIVILALVSASSLFHAQAEAQVGISWYTIDGGGGTSAGEVFHVDGTIGQPDSGDSSGGIYRVIGGFWSVGGVSGEEPTPTPVPATPTATPVCVSDLDMDSLCDEVEGENAPGTGRTNLYLPDSDGDGLGDGVEDVNRDGMSSADETDPLGRDTDGDLYQDGVEVLLIGSDPLQIVDPPPTYMDQDGDDLPGEGSTWPLDPDETDRDCDDDRFTDGYEAVHGEIHEAPDAWPPLGDVNGTYNVDNADSQLILNFFAKQMTPGTDFRWGDVNRDAVEDNADSQLVLNFFARMLDHLPAP
jgi:hypothetical protein